MRAWGPPDGGRGLALDSVTDMASAAAGARLGVGGLGSGQVRLGEVVDRTVLSAADGASAQPGDGHDVATGRDLRRPARPNDGGDSDEVQHQGGQGGVGGCLAQIHDDGARHSVSVDVDPKGGPSGGPAPRVGSVWRQRARARKAAQRAASQLDI